MIDIKKEIKESEPHQKKERILFTCSGCSDAGYLAHQLGLSLHDKGYAEMSCIAGLSAGKEKFLRKIREKKVILIDGCKTACGKEIFRLRKLKIDHYIPLHQHGVLKNNTVSKPTNSDKVLEIGKNLNL